MSNVKVTSPAQLSGELEQDSALRPRLLRDFVGQEKIKENLQVALQAAAQRGDALDHVLLSGPPGLGKTTLANIIANELGVRITVTSGPALQKPAELASLLAKMPPRDMLFIDEIHRLPRIIEEYIYPAMEDFKIDLPITEGKYTQVKINPFTLIGATTRAGLLTSPLRDRFGLSFRIENYTPEELRTILGRSSRILEMEMSPGALELLGARCRGTPRIANRILRRCRDVAQVGGKKGIDETIANRTLDMLAIDALGLDEMDRQILRAIIQKFDNGPVGLNNLGAALGEETSTLEDVYEPYLIQQGLIQRTPRGRIATRRAYEHLGLAVPRNTSQEALFET